MHLPRLAARPGRLVVGFALGERHRLPPPRSTGLTQQLLQLGDPGLPRRQRLVQLRPRRFEPRHHPTKIRHHAGQIPSLAAPRTRNERLRSLGSAYSTCYRVTLPGWRAPLSFTANRLKIILVSTGMRLITASDGAVAMSYQARATGNFGGLR